MSQFSTRNFRIICGRKHLTRYELFTEFSADRLTPGSSFLTKPLFSIFQHFSLNPYFLPNFPRQIWKVSNCHFVQKKYGAPRRRRSSDERISEMDRIFNTVQRGNAIQRNVESGHEKNFIPESWICGHEIRRVLNDLHSFNDLWRCPSSLCYIVEIIKICMAHSMNCWHLKWLCLKI